MAAPSSVTATEAFLIELSTDYFEEDDFDTFLLTNYGATLVKVQRENFHELRRPFIIAFHHFEKYTSDLKQWTNILYKAALKYNGRIQYAVADFKESSSILNLDYLHAECSYMGDMWSPWTCGFDEQNRRYKVEFFMKLEKFSEKLLKGELYRSESVPADTNNELVKVAVADNFQDLVLKSDKDVFITFYDSDSDLSNELVSRLDELAELMKEENILVVKMQGENNYVHLEYNVHYYPKSVYMPRENQSKFILYDLPIRPIENLIKFIAANATEELKAYDREGVLRDIV